MSARVVAEGTIAWKRSDSRDCICCEGAHVFSRSVVLDPEAVDQSVHIRGDSDYAGWMHHAVWQMPEGARVRITVEEI